MKTIKAEWSGRLSRWIRTLRQDFYRPIGDFKWEMFRTMDELSYEDAVKHEFEPVDAGFTWGNTWEYAWFRTKITLPEEADGKRIVMDLKPGWEATVFVDGAAFGTYRAEWVNVNHHYIVDNDLTRCGEAGRTYEIVMEVYAGHYFPEEDCCATGPVLPGTFNDPKSEGSRVTLGHGTFGIWNEDAYQLYMDVDTLVKLHETLDQSSLRAAKVAEALEKFTLIVDFEQAGEERTKTYIEARKVLKPALEAVNGSTAPVFYGIGNAHIDLAWLWPMQETYRKTARTFAAQLRHIEEYPDYKYIQSQPAAYEMCRKYYPELFERIKKAVKGGQWIADGAMWVEPDTNMTGGEALIRQLVHGKRYYKDMFDVESEVLWLPDTFGYTGALPQILKGCNVKYLVTQKIFWTYNDSEQFPYHYFNWEGIDGTQVVSFLPTSYTYRTNPDEIADVWKNRTQVRDLDAFLFPYGYGDGGGGPVRDHIESARRERDLEGLPKFKMEGPKKFFEDMEEQSGKPVNTYKGELYFTAHRGTYTSQAMIKKNNRLSEIMLREMEMWGTLASLKGMDYPLAKADELWKQLLLHQFHDILPGSSIARVYVEAEKAHHELQAAAKMITDSALAKLTDESERVTVFNSLSFERTAVVTLKDSFADGAVTALGTEVYTEKTADGVKALVTVPACGCVVLTPAKKNTEKHQVTVKETGDGYVMENSKLIAKVNKMGELTSYILKSTGREFAAEPMNRFRLFKDVPRNFDAWDIDSCYTEQEIEAAYDVNTRIYAEGIEGIISVSGKISKSTYTQKIVLAADSDRIDFVTEIDWKELHRLLKVSFPANVYAEQGINEMQFGFVNRPTHKSRAYDQDRFEVSNHRYSALCDNAHGVAVLNDCKYGISMNENALELTLLKSPTSPEMQADNRVHPITYSVYAWEGTFADSDTVRRGYEVNVPVQVVNGGTEEFSFVNIDKENIILDTVKPAEDGSKDVILRFYESKKAAVTAKFKLEAEGFTAYECDMLENKQNKLEKNSDGTYSLDFRAFEIKTLRFTKQ